MMGPSQLTTPCPVQHLCSAFQPCCCAVLPRTCPAPDCCSLCWEQTDPLAHFPPSLHLFSSRSQANCCLHRKVWTALSKKANPDSLLPPSNFLYPFTTFYLLREKIIHLFISSSRQELHAGRTQSFRGGSLGPAQSESLKTLLNK